MSRIEREIGATTLYAQVCVRVVLLIGNEVVGDSALKNLKSIDLILLNLAAQEAGEMITSIPPAPYKTG